MLRQLPQRPSPQKVATLYATAQGLAVDLENELVRLDQGLHYGIPFPEIYNKLYLPIAKTLADDLRGIRELEVLRSPMRADLTTTHLRITLLQLYRLIAALDAT